LGPPAKRVGGQRQTKIPWKVANNGDPLLPKNKVGDKRKAPNDAKGPKKKSKRPIVNSDEGDDADDESEELSGDELDEYERMRGEIEDEEKVCIF
jgi:hypothetical protein